MLREPSALFYNDLGSRAHLLDLPTDRVHVHSVLSSSLRAKLQIPSLGSLHLQPMPFQGEDMREDLTTRISNVLRQYDIEQAFNELLANAADAGATKCNFLLDCDEARNAPSNLLLCESMAPFCRGPALVVHNNAEFTEDDIRGICRVGRGGKEEHESSIGRFGLGALSFYHFSEVCSTRLNLSLVARCLTMPLGCNDSVGLVLDHSGPFRTQSPSGMEQELVRHTSGQRPLVRACTMIWESCHLRPSEQSISGTYASVPWIVWFRRD